MTPSAEQIAQWEKEAKELYPINGMQTVHREGRQMSCREGYLAGRQAAFEEVAELRKELEECKKRAGTV